MEPKNNRKRRGRPIAVHAREEIIEAAISEFGRSGYANANMDAVAANAGVSKRTLYTRFDSKEALFQAVVEEAMMRISVSAALDYAPSLSLHLQLKRYANASVKLLRDPKHLNLFRVIVGEHMLNPALVEPGLGNYWKREYGFAAWIKDAIADKRLVAADPVRASHLFASLMRGIMFWPALLGRHHFESRNLNAAIDEAIDVFLAYYATKKRKP